MNKPSPSPIRVMLVDDHDVVRRGMGVLLQTLPDMELVGEAADGSEAVALCGEMQPDVILMDVLMPEMDGIEATRQIKAAHPQVQVLILTSTREEEAIKSALQAGAIGFLLKNVTLEEMADALRNAARGQSTLSPAVTQALVNATARKAETDYHLTDRERELLVLLSTGLSNQDIAARLTISLSTVKFHMSSILAKLGASNRTEAVAKAREKHLIDT